MLATGCTAAQTASEASTRTPAQTASQASTRTPAQPANEASTRIPARPANEAAQRSAAQGTGEAPARSAAAQLAGVHRFAIGDVQAIALNDGHGVFPNNGKVFAINQDPKALAAVLAAAALPTDALTVNVGALLLRSGNQIVLVDTGAGAMMPTAGQLANRLLQAGITPEQITDVVISHAHPDHIGGLVRATGGLAYPNARIHLAAAEFQHLQKQPERAALIRLIAPRVVSFAPGATIAPDIQTLAIQGHTPGHVGVAITSRGQRLLYVGDTVHHYVVSLAQPEWRIAFDADAPTAETSRRALLQRAADERLLLFAPHFPFPSIGTVQRQGSGFVWQPANM